MQNYEKFNKAHIKLADLQRKIATARDLDLSATPLDVTNMLFDWFEQKDSVALRFDILHYAVTHMWKNVAEKTATTSSAIAAEKRLYQHRIALRERREAAISEAADKAVEQIVSTLKLMTFKQARMLHGATSKLDLSLGKDDELLGDVFTDAEIRSAVT
jgi:hypothetical protein